MLYHGTTAAGLRYIKANSRSHSTGKPVAYFTMDRCYALICCRDRRENFVTMGLREDGKQHYYERFPDQLRTLYSGRRGYLYYVETAPEGMLNTQGRIWESGTDVPVSGFQVVEDVYREIVEESAKGNIVIHGYYEIDPAEQKLHANYIKEHLGDEGEVMEQFYLKHFSKLWD